MNDVEIIEGDCREHLGRFAGAVDLVLTSPPYDALRDYGGHGFDWRSVADAIVPVLKPGGVLVWIVQDATVEGAKTGTSFAQAQHFAASGLLWHDTLIYAKRGGIPHGWAGRRHEPRFEFMFVFANGKPATIEIIADQPARNPGTRMNPTYRQVDGSMQPAPRDWTAPEFYPRGSVWTYDSGYGKSQTWKRAYDHPATFPYPLAVDHVRTWTKPGDLVLDPMAGSGTTLRAAVDHNRRAVGMEIEPSYVAIIRERMAQGVLL